jgi:hypothetical protein
MHHGLGVGQVQIVGLEFGKYHEPPMQLHNHQTLLLHFHLELNSLFFLANPFNKNIECNIHLTQVAKKFAFLTDFELLTPLIINQEVCIKVHAHTHTHINKIFHMSYTTLINEQAHYKHSTWKNTQQKCN